MPSSPVIEWRASTTPFAVLSSIALVGTGYSGAIPLGTTSSAVTVRLYNNFSAAGSIVDAQNCVLAAYDDTVHQGTAITPPSTGLYLQVEVLDYNGVPGYCTPDTQYIGLGGTTKHAIPCNGGTISGGGANYCTISITAEIPANATQGSVSQGLWLEYTSTA